jgi:signal transduction histidine kinase
LTVEMQSNETLPISCVSRVLDSVGTPVLISDRTGRILMANESAKHYLNASGGATTGAVLESADGLEGRDSNLFQDVLHMDAEAVVGQIENGEHELDLEVARPEGKVRAHVQWLPERDWLLVRLDASIAAKSDLLSDTSGQPTVQALLQEREITYRNLLAAYLRLQEVNRQKTVFLASAAHELKTPLAVIKGYYDLLLSGSLGHLNDKQRDILQESKESCERLVRLVSMFLNYSTLESGKLVLHLRENDLRDCLLELASRWHEAFQRKRVRLDVAIDESLPRFKFDYQKVQQAVANLLDNALKHTPVGGSVTMRSEAHFWERRNGKDIPFADRRKDRNHTANAARIAVTDTGPGIATEHHQEIFEDFVRVDRTSSGMGLGLAIAKRLVQAHRGKIWVDSTPRQGCTFTFLLPTDNAVRDEG